MEEKPAEMMMEEEKPAEGDGMMEGM